MGLKLVSHVNADSDLIEAWLKYYLGLGVERFHLVVHGTRDENERLLAVRDSYPITIEDSYEGSFHIEEKKSRLDAVLARHTGGWIVLADSDEFVEFPYRDIPETVHALDSAGANFMAAPMLQRLTADGSLETPAIIEHPFKLFPLCSIDLYRKMGVKGDIFKFPLFFCAGGTQLAEGGNHHPPVGSKPRATTLRGVTHHFKLRRTVSERLDKRINSAHPWRQESVLFREYLEAHSNRLPVDGAFAYSRDDLFRRGLLRALPVVKPGCDKSSAPSPLYDHGRASTPRERDVEATGPGIEKPLTLSVAARKKILFVLPKSTEFGGLEKHLLDFLERLPETSSQPSIVCFDQDIISAHLNQELRSRVVVKCIQEPQSLGDWRRMFRQANPDTVVFCNSWIEAFPWQAPVGAFLAGVRRRFSIQHLIPPPQPPPPPGNSPANLLRRLIGKRARRLASLRASAHTLTDTICVSNAVRDSLVGSFGFPARKTITVRNGVSTVTFAPSPANGAAVRARLDIGPEEFLLVCAARLVEAKGIDVLIHAVSRVLRQGVPCKCIVVGDGVLKERLIELVNSLGVSDCTFFEGFQKDVRPYLQAASAFILTSYLEGLPLSVLEAMACGLPCIVTDVGGSAEAVKHQVAGLVIPPGSIDAAEDAILYLATHPDERAEMARKSRETVCQLFDIETRMGELRGVLLS
jgi:glycosyltransferase involved in cell wall biosynthesis